MPAQGARRPPGADQLPAPPGDADRLGPGDAYAPDRLLLTGLEPRGHRAEVGVAGASGVLVTRVLLTGVLVIVVVFFFGAGGELLGEDHHPVYGGVVRELQCPDRPLREHRLDE